MRSLLPVSRITGTIRRAWTSGRPLPLQLHLLALVLAVLLPALAGAGYAAWRAAYDQRLGFETRLLDTARALALAVDREIEVYEVALAALATSPLLDAEDDAQLGAFHAQAAPIAEALGTWIILPDRTGTRQVVNTEFPWGAPLPSLDKPPGGAVDRAAKAVLETGRPALVDTAITSTTAEGWPVAPVMVPVLRGGRAVRLLAAALNPPRMSHLLAAQDLRGSGIAGLADGAGRLLARSFEPERHLGAAIPSWSRIAANGAPEGLVDATDLEGRRMVFAFHRLARNPAWTVAVGEPWAAYAASWRQPLVELCAVILAAFALGAVAATGQARRLLRPLRALAERSEAIAAETLAGVRPASSAPPRPPGPPPAAEPDAWPVAEFEALRHRIGQAEAALCDSEAWLRDLLDAIPVVVWVTTASPPGYCTHLNRRWTEMTGQPRTEAFGFGWLLMLHPEDRDRKLANHREAVARREGFRIEHRLHVAEAKGGEEEEWRWVLEAVEPRVAPDGALLGHVGAIIDITERREAETRRDLLAREVDHRAKNVLAVVQAVLRLTPKDDPRDYATSIEGRVRALARAHALLAAERWTGADLRALLEEELRPFATAPAGKAASGRVEPSANPPQRILLHGPPVMLPPIAVQPVGMLVHELATNAAKHGALSAPRGRVVVSWSIESGSGLLRLRWTEQGGPPLAGPPERRGFGTRMVEATVRDQLGGRVQRFWNATGLVCEVELPLAGREALPSPHPAPIAAEDGGR